MHDVLAKLTIHGADKMSTAQRQEIVFWLDGQIKQFLYHNEEFAKTYSATFRKGKKA